jgi:hypothetical protein
LRSVDLSRLGLRPEAVRIVWVFGGKWWVGVLIHVCGLRLYHVRAGFRCDSVLRVEIQVRREYSSSVSLGCQGGGVIDVVVGEGMVFRREFLKEGKSKRVACRFSMMIMCMGWGRRTGGCWSGE